jgi:hypothetical protein
MERMHSPHADDVPAWAHVDAAELGEFILVEGKQTT